MKLNYIHPDLGYINFTQDSYVSSTGVTFDTLPTDSVLLDNAKVIEIKKRVKERLKGKQEALLPVVNTLFNHVDKTVLPVHSFELVSVNFNIPHSIFKSDKPVMLSLNFTVKTHAGGRGYNLNFTFVLPTLDEITNGKVLWAYTDVYTTAKKDFELQLADIVKAFFIVGFTSSFRQSSIKGAFESYLNEKRKYDTLNY